MGIRNNYDYYENKLTRKVKLKGFFKRFRVLFIVLFAFIAIGFSVFAIGAGRFTSNLVITNVSYGENVEISTDATSFLSKVSYYEYRKAPTDSLNLSTITNEWTKTKPTKAGNYQIRAVSEGAFGVIRYSNPVDFTIDKKECDASISQSLKQLTYGTDPQLENLNISNSLISGDYVLEDSLSFIYEETNGETYVQLDLSTLVILNNGGEDVTDCYNFNVRKSKITINSKPICVKFNNIDFAYDGTIHEIIPTLSTSTTSELVKNDQISDIQYKIYDSKNNQTASCQNCDNKTGICKYCDKYEYDINNHSTDEIKRFYPIFPADLELYDYQKTSERRCNAAPRNFISGVYLPCEQRRN